MGATGPMIDAMATTLQRLGLVMALFSTVLCGSPLTKADTVVRADSDAAVVATFRGRLEPHGAWVEEPTYGLVWVPSVSVVGPDFKPYVTAGHWGLAENGDWVWVSDYPFGDVVFHYGRWVWVSGTGWAWVPGTEWAPAWVVWRVPHGSYDYVGWAPAPPSYVWVNGVFVSLWWTPPPPWVFCHSSYVFHYHVGHHIVRDRLLVHRVAQNTYRYRPHGSAIYRAPSMDRARVPAASVPRVRTTTPRPVMSGAPGRVAARPAVGQPADTASSALTTRNRMPTTTAVAARGAGPSASPALTRPANVAPTPARAVTTRYDPRTSAPQATVARPPPYTGTSRSIRAGTPTYRPAVTPRTPATPSVRAATPSPGRSSLLRSTSGGNRSGRRR
jgi:hypothetical protein